MKIGESLKVVDAVSLPVPVGPTEKDELPVG